MISVKIKNNNIGEIEAFVFDKDGTLIDLYTYWSGMAALRAERVCSYYNLVPQKHKKLLMSAMGVDWRRHKIKPEGPIGIVSRAKVQEAVDDYLIALGYKDVSDTCKLIFNEVDEASIVILKKLIKPVRGLRELFMEIKKRGAKIAIATNDKTKRAELIFKILKLDNLVDFIIGSDRIANAKPAPDALIKAAAYLNIPLRRMVMVGDAENDIKMGFFAGCKASVGVYSGQTPRENLAKLTPYVIRDISQIKLV